MLTQSHPERAAKLLELAQGDVKARWEGYAQLAGQSGNGKGSVIWEVERRWVNGNSLFLLRIQSPFHRKGETSWT